ALPIWKLYPKIGEKTAAEVWARISAAPNPLEAFLHGPSPGASRDPLPASRGEGPSSVESPSPRSRGEGGRRPNEGRLNLLKSLLEMLAGEGMKHNPSESIRLIVEKGYGDYARAKFANAQARLDDLEQLSQYALRYDDVNAFLEEVALANPLAGEDVAVVGPEDEKVVLSSVHQAKGLEWRIVFVIWLADGRFPSQRALRVPGGVVRIKPKELHEAFELTEALVGGKSELAIEEMPAGIVDDAAP